MKKNSASEKELGELHAHLAKTLAAKLQASDRATLLLVEFPDLPEEVKEYLEDQVDVSPALLTVAAKFLKDNDITCVIEESNEMSELQQRLAEKKAKRKQVGNVIPFDED